MTITSIILLVLFVLILVGCGKAAVFTKPKPPDIPQPLVVRTDLFFGYYGGVLAETIDHVNIHFAGTWFGQATQLSEVIAAHNAGIPIILDVADQMSIPFDAPSAAFRLRERLRQLSDIGALGSITALYFDEPNHNHRLTDVEVEDMAEVMRSVSGEFGVFPKIMMSYSKNGTFPGIAWLDWIALNSYDAGTEMITNGDLAVLKALKLPHQKLFLSIAGCDPWRVNPTQFFNMAEQDRDIVGIMVFAWSGGDESGIANGWGKGVRSNGMASTYSAVGLKIKYAGRAGK